MLGGVAWRMSGSPGRPGTYACAVSEPDPGAAREGELEAFRRAAHAAVDGVADHLAALPSRPVWQPLPDALREQLLDAAAAGPRGLARRAGRDRAARRPAARHGQRPPGLLRLGQLAAVPRRRRRLAGGGRDEPGHRVRRPRRRLRRARRGALAGRAGRLPARAGRRPAHERRLRRDDRLLRGRPRSRAGGGRARRPSRRPRRRAAARRLRPGRGSQLRAARARVARSRQRGDARRAARRRPPRRGCAARLDRRGSRRRRACRRCSSARPAPSTPA